MSQLAGKVQLPLTKAATVIPVAIARGNSGRNHHNNSVADSDSDLFHQRGRSYTLVNRSISGIVAKSIASETSLPPRTALPTTIQLANSGVFPSTGLLRNTSARSVAGVRRQLGNAALHCLFCLFSRDQSALPITSL